MVRASNWTAVMQSKILACQILGICGSLTLALQLTKYPTYPSPPSLAYSPRQGEFDKKLNTGKVRQDGLFNRLGEARRRLGKDG